jgi:hypothetical protein
MQPVATALIIGIRQSLGMRTFVPRLALLAPLPQYVRAFGGNASTETGFRLTGL